MLSSTSLPIHVKKLPSYTQVRFMRASPNSDYRPSITRKKTYDHTRLLHPGLYGTAKPLTTGYKVSESEHKTKRLFKPNVFNKSMWSDVLGKSVKMNVVPEVLTEMDKKGGFDNYLLDAPERKFEGQKLALLLRWSLETERELKRISKEKTQLD
jgi:ribosomal protein L28